MKARGLLLATILVLTGACAQQGPVPQDHFYRLIVGPAENPFAGPHLKGTLEVERLAGDGLVAGRPIIYSEAATPNRLREYNYRLWTEAPTVMLRDQLVAYLRSAKAATTVLTPEMRTIPDYVLGGKIRRLEKVIGSPPQVVVELELAIRRTRDSRIVFLDTYKAQVDAENDSIGAAVAAMNQALGQVYARFVKDLSKI